MKHPRTLSLVARARAFQTRPWAQNLKLSQQDVAELLALVDAKVSPDAQREDAMALRLAMDSVTGRLLSYSEALEINRLLAQRKAGS